MSRSPRRVCTPPSPFLAPPPNAALPAAAPRSEGFAFSSIPKPAFSWTAVFLRVCIFVIGSLAVPTPYEAVLLSNACLFFSVSRLLSLSLYPRPLRCTNHLPLFSLGCGDLQIAVKRGAGSDVCGSTSGRDYLST
ncbi:unnamed protein product [Ectocarpus sp. 12 AP-2014]